ncbi:MAG: methyl-accepting chemotaxis protein [Peptococcaceae bacterium]|nr:methyl-accepting chemotaxis protein [Peptococcaceae bacterium]
MNIFDINTKMDAMRQAALQEKNQQYLDELYEGFDKRLQVGSFVRKYIPTPVQPLTVSDEDINKAFAALGKFDESDKNYDCGACGSDTCLEMAKAVAKGINIPTNCVEKAHKDIKKEHQESINAQITNLNNLIMIHEDTANIKEITQSIMSSLTEITDAISSYNRMIADIEKIAMQVNIIAINASIESSRAGEYGKSFGVVAQEIRNLAQSSSASAQQTKQSSTKATNAVESLDRHISQITEKTGTSFDRIGDIVEKMKGL